VNPTWYDILGVAPDASSTEIKQAWREAAERFEPGSGGVAQFRLFNEAAEVLLDPERRAAYDAELDTRDGGAGASVVDPSVPGAGLAAAGAAMARKVDGEPAAEPDSGPDFGADSGQVEDSPRDDDAAPGAGLLARALALPVAVLVVLAVLAAGAVGVAAYLGFESTRATAYQEALDRAPAAAERAAVAVLSYDHETLEADRSAAGEFLTDSYRTEYFDTYELVQQDAGEQEAKVEAEVKASSAMVQGDQRDPDRVPVLLFVDQTTRSKATGGEPRVDLNRVQMTMVKVDGTWLVDDITSY
jgi:Mce-associated membrane protein